MRSRAYTRMVNDGTASFGPRYAPPADHCHLVRRASGAGRVLVEECGITAAGLRR
jgi:hypothetical protein